MDRERGFLAATSKQQGPTAIHNSEGSKPSSLIGGIIDPSVWSKSLLIFSLSLHLTFGSGYRHSDRERVVVQGTLSVSIPAGGIKKGTFRELEGTLEITKREELVKENL